MRVKGRLFEGKHGCTVLNHYSQANPLKLGLRPHLPTDRLPQSDSNATLKGVLKISTS